MAGHTIAFRKPRTPIQKPVAVEIKYTAAPRKPRPYTADDPEACPFTFSFIRISFFHHHSQGWHFLFSLRQLQACLTDRYPLRTEYYKPGDNFSWQARNCNLHLAIHY